MKPSKAHGLVARAVADGTLTRQGCEVGHNCSGRVRAHHDDYNRPLDVRWLCDRHHRLWHSRNAAAGADPGDGLLIRAALTPAEYREIRKLAITRGVPVSDLATEALRALLKGAKP